MIGNILNQRYRLDSELGQGGMGVVYRGYDHFPSPVMPGVRAADSYSNDMTCWVTAPAKAFAVEILLIYRQP
jgi:serine/threonine protein kinase